MNTSDKQKLIRRNIEINAERANREWSKNNKREVPESVKQQHLNAFKNAQYKAERERNIKRGIK